MTVIVVKIVVVICVLGIAIGVSAFKAGQLLVDEIKENFKKD